MKIIIALFLLLASAEIHAQEIALLKYSGGGDWYANPTSLLNLIKYCNRTLNSRIKAKPATVEPSSPDLFAYPMVHMTGHGNVVFSDSDLLNLRQYMLSGGFLHIDDNYGMDQYVRREIKRLFPDRALTEIPSTHAIFQKPHPFPSGLPKIHEHDGKRPQAFGLFEKGRLILLYTYETDLGDGWEDPEVNNDPAEVREKALRMGANIVHHIFSN